MKRYYEKKDKNNSLLVNHATYSIDIKKKKMKQIHTQRKREQHTHDKYGIKENKIVMLDVHLARIRSKRINLKNKT